MRKPEAPTGTSVLASEAFCSVLRAWGVTRVFGNPGLTEIPILYRLAEAYPEIRYYLALHEDVAVGMADGFARAANEPAVVMLHATPGVTHGLGNLYNASFDESPVVMVAGQQDSRTLIDGPPLAGDPVRMSEQLCKWAWEVKWPGEVARALDRALRYAMQPPAGPVLLSVPRDFLEAEVPASPLARRERREACRAVPDRAAISEAVTLLARSADPVILVGDHVEKSGVTEAVLELARQLGAPIYTEPYCSRASVPSGAPALIGPRTKDVRELVGPIGEADCVLAVGCRLFTQLGFEPQQVFRKGSRLIHLHPDGWQSARSNPEVTLTGDVSASVGALLAEMEARRGELDASRIAARHERVASARRQVAASVEREKQNGHDRDPLSVWRLLGELQARVGDGAIVVDEAGRSAGHLLAGWNFGAPGTYYAKKGACLGWGMPAALGVQVAQPEATVVCLVGDGAVMYNSPALWTAAHYNLPVLYIVCNNSGYMAMKDNFRTYRADAVSLTTSQTEFPGIDYVMLARSMGVWAESVTRPAELGPALERALADRRPALLDVRIDPNDAGYGRRAIAGGGRERR